MYDRGKIIAGIIIFVGLMTFPFWYNRGKAAPAPEPKTDTPVIQQLKEKQCLEPTPYMKTMHMKLLDSWRDSVVRKGNRVYVGMGAKKYDMSLQNTCMNCHSNKSKFCDQCHNYVGVNPYCWDCHIEPKEKR